MREYDLGTLCPSADENQTRALATTIAMLAEFARRGVDLLDLDSVDAFIAAFQRKTARRLFALIRFFARQKTFVVSLRRALRILRPLRLPLVSGSALNGPNGILAAYPRAVGSLA